MTGIAKYKTKAGLLLAQCLLTVNLLFYFLSPLSVTSFKQHGENSMIFKAQGETLTGSVFDDSQLYTSAARINYPLTKFKTGFDFVSLATGVNCDVRDFINRHSVSHTKTSGHAQVTPLFKLYCSFKIPFV